MTQPKFAPITLADEVRKAQKLEPVGPWIPHRPGDPTGRATIRPERGEGVPGPDQGYALRLAELFCDRLVLEPAEHAGDVIAGAVAIALRRAARYGRAPVKADLEVALELFGDLSPADADLVAYRKEAFSGVAHDYWKLRELAALVPESTLSLSPAEVVARRQEWRVLVGLPGSSELS